jgi:RND family efflux transporter MFP subunit
MRPRPEPEHDVTVRLVSGSRRLSLWLIGLALPFAGCTQPKEQAGAPPPPDVEVVQVQQKDVPSYAEWIGTLDGFVNAAITAQVSGYLQRQLYSEGAFVTKGQVLFEIDPRPFQAVVDQAEGQLAQANGQVAQAKAQVAQAQAQLGVAVANQVKTQQDEDRYAPLAKQQAITQQDMDNAVQSNLASKAQVQAARAAVETAQAQLQAAIAGVATARAALDTARLNLGFTKLIAPVNGIAGLAQQQVGSLVGPASGPVTTVSTVDPIKAYFTVTEQEYLSYTRRYPNAANRESNEQRLVLHLILADGSVYPRSGKFFFADRQVDPTTGAIRLAGLFPNPGNILRPGQYGRVRSQTDIVKGALLVPQRAVTELQGTYQVAIVAGDRKVRIQPVTVGAREGSMWIVTEGLKPGEQLVAEGVQKVRQGMQVNPKGQ